MSGAYHDIYTKSCIFTRLQPVIRQENTCILQGVQCQK